MYFILYAFVKLLYSDVLRQLETQLENVDNKVDKLTQQNQTIAGGVTVLTNFLEVLKTT